MTVSVGIVTLPTGGTDKRIVRELPIPLTPKIQPPHVHGFRLRGFARPAVEDRKTLVQSRHSWGIPQVGQRLRLGRHHLVEQVLINLNRAMGIAFLRLVIRQRGSNDISVAVKFDLLGAIILRFLYDRQVATRRQVVRDLMQALNGDVVNRHGAFGIMATQDVSQGIATGKSGTTSSTCEIISLPDCRLRPPPND